MVVAYCNGGFLCALLQETHQSDQTREDVQKGLFDAFHILKKIADNLKKPVKKYGNSHFPIIYQIILYRHTENNLDKNQPRKKKLRLLWDPDPSPKSILTFQELSNLSYPKGLDLESRSSRETGRFYRAEKGFMPIFFTVFAC